MVFIRTLFLIYLYSVSIIVMADIGASNGYSPSVKIKEIERDVKNSEIVNKSLDEAKKIIVEKFNADILDKKISDHPNQLIFVISDRPTTAGVYSSLICDLRFDENRKVISISTSYVNSGP